MLYPDPYFDVSLKRWKIGNTDLTNAWLHTVRLEYIFDNVTTDISRTGANTTEYAYDLYNRRIILGASCRIGGRK